MEDYFHTTVGVRHGVLLSPVLLNIFLEGIMPETLHDQHTSILLDGRLTCNLRFANRFHGRHQHWTARPDRQLQHIWNGHQQSRVEREAKTEIDIKEAHLEKKSFNYLGTILSKEGNSTADIRIRNTTGTPVMARLDRIWYGNTIKPIFLQNMVATFVGHQEPILATVKLWFYQVTGQDILRLSFRLPQR